MPKSSTLPLASGVWTLDPAHSALLFRIRHLGLSNVHGRFDRFNATLSVGNRIEDIVVTASIDMASVNTNNADRDSHLRGTDFFSVETHPEATFRSTSVREHGGDDYELEGALTIGGITHQVVLAVEFNGIETFPADGSTRAGFTASTEINREDFGIDFNMPFGMDKVALGQKARIELDLQFIAP